MQKALQMVLGWLAPCHHPPPRPPATARTARGEGQKWGAKTGRASRQTHLVLPLLCTGETETGSKWEREGKTQTDPHSGRAKEGAIWTKWLFSSSTLEEVKRAFRNTRKPASWASLAPKDHWGRDGKRQLLRLWRKSIIYYQEFVMVTTKKKERNGGG